MRHVLPILVCLGCAACATADAPGSIQRPPTVHGSDAPPQEDAAGCIPELYAYTSVLTLAKKLGPQADVYDDALIDLRDQLVQCLTDQPAQLIEVHRRGQGRS